MPTKGYFVEQAMKRANVWEGHTPEQQTDCLQAFEAMVWEWAGADRPILFNYPFEETPKAITQVPRIPRNLESALIANGAVEASLLFRIPVTTDLAKKARETKERVTPVFIPTSARVALVGWPQGSGSCRRPRFIVPQKPQPEEDF